MSVTQHKCSTGASKNEQDAGEVDSGQSILACILAPARFPTVLQDLAGEPPTQGPALTGPPTRR